MLDQHGWPRAGAKTPRAWPARSPALPLSRPTTNLRRSILVQPASVESATTPTHVSHCDAPDLASPVRLSPVVNNRECFKINDTFTMPDERPTFALAWRASIWAARRTDYLDSEAAFRRERCIRKGVESAAARQQQDQAQSKTLLTASAVSERNSIISCRKSSSRFRASR